MRKSTQFLIFSGVNVAVFTALMAHAAVTGGRAPERLASGRQFVKRLRLTDLCLFTEARYTRNPAVADRHAAFQDHPMALEHFPSGGLVSPPASRRGKP